MDEADTDHEDANKDLDEEKRNPTPEIIQVHVQKYPDVEDGKDADGSNLDNKTQTAYCSNNFSKSSNKEGQE